MAAGVSKAFPAFDVALKRGVEREQQFASIFGDKIGVTIECKSQLHSHEYGFVFIEYMCRGRFSGIATTEADYWAIECGEEGNWVLIPIVRMRALAAEAYGAFGERRGGEEGASLGVIVPLKWLVTPT